MKRYALLVVFLASPLFAAATPYHLQLEAYPAAPFPFLSKFGTVTIDVYAGGVHGESLWLSAFSRNGSKTLTVLNPLARMYTDIPVDDITAILAKLSASERVDTGVPAVLPPVSGKVAGIAAKRYRIVFSPAAWIDLWTTSAIPPNPQLAMMVEKLLDGIAPPTAVAARTIPGTPLYVELNFRRFRNVVLVRTKKLTFTSDGEADALKPGSFYFKAPLLDSVWR